MSAGAVVEGYISLLVPDHEAFAEDAQAAAALESAVAGIAGVHESRVSVEVDAARRLQQAQDAATSATSSGRRMDAGTVIVQYTILPGDKVTAWTAALAMDAVGKESVSAAVTTELQTAGLDVYAESLSVLSLGITERPAAPPPDYAEAAAPGGLDQPGEGEGSAITATLVGGGLLVVCGSLTCTACVVRERRKRKDTTCIQDAVFDMDKKPVDTPPEAVGDRSLPVTPREDEELAHGVHDLDDLAQAVLSGRPLPNGTERSGAPGGASGPSTSRNSSTARGGEWALHPPTREESGMSAVSLEPQINTAYRHAFWSLDMEEPPAPSPGGPGSPQSSASMRVAL